MSYSKRPHTFRTAGGNSPAARARLGSEPLVNFKEHSVVPSGLVRKLCLQHRPTRVENGLSHPRFRELGRAGVADRDKLVVADNLRRPLVNVVTARVADLGMDRAGPALVTGALRDRKGGLVLPIVTKRLNLVAVAACGQCLQAEVNTDATIPSGEGARHFTLEADVPAPTGILNEAPSLDLPVNVARLPEVEGALHVADGGGLELHGARNKRNPAKRPLGAKAGPEVRTTPVQVTRGDELAADRLHGVAVQSEFGAGAGAELYQVERRRPTHGKPGLTAALSRPLRGDAEVPDLIARNSVAVQVLSARCVLDAVFERQHHASAYSWSEGKMQPYRAGRHCVFALHVHLVFVTKYRRDVLSEPAIRDLNAVFAKVCADFNARLVECNGEDDHVHILVEYPPQVSISKLVNSLKGVSSRLLRMHRPEISGRYFKGVLWSPSYFAASCGGAPISVIRQYVEQQRAGSGGPPPPRPKRRGIRRENT